MGKTILPQDGQTRYLYTMDMFKNTVMISANDFYAKVAAFTGYTHNQPLWGSSLSCGLDLGVVGYHDDLITMNITYEFALSTGTTAGDNDEALLDKFIADYNYIPYTDTVVTAQEIQPSGTPGGTFTAGAWQTRTLNTLIGMQTFATIANNIVSVSIGTYLVIVTVPSCNVGANQCRVLNHRTNTYMYGTNSYSIGNGIGNTTIRVYIDSPLPTSFSIEHFCETTVPDIGFGKSLGFGTQEIYTSCSIQQVFKYDYGYTL